MSAVSPVSRARLFFAALAVGSALGCGPQFDPSSELSTLRVLAVKKDAPYAQPGQTVNLQLLWHDPEGRTDLQRAFIGGCVNPPGDLFYGCFAQYGQFAAAGSPPPFGFGDTFAVTLPSDIISSRRGPVEPRQARYGLYIVFFAVCAGRLDFDMDVDPASEGSTGLPIRCLDENDEPLGSKDFIVGYTSIYSFQDVTNHNPSFTTDADGQGEFFIAGEQASADCVGEACQGAAALEGIDCSRAGESRCIKACPDDGDPSCPAIEVAPGIEQEVERDDATSHLIGYDLSEQMWVNYYVDRGGISEVRLLNDATTGWNAKYRAQLRAPKAAGPVQVWAVAHDNRGGIEFSRVTLQVEE